MTKQKADQILLEIGKDLSEKKRFPKNYHARMIAYGYLVLFSLSTETAAPIEHLMNTTKKVI